MRGSCVVEVTEANWSRANQYPIQGSLLKPASNPTYYEDLIKELEEAPTRSWFGRWKNKWRGFVRFQ